MYEITCLDLNRNTINNFFQWDVDQKIMIELKGCDENYLSIAPEVHFSNTSRKEALVVRSTVSNKDTITVDVPNVLLQESFPLLVYVYLTDSQDVSSQKTILYSEIPIRKRQKPSDYEYVENITRITAEDIKNEIELATRDTRKSAIATIEKTRDDAITDVDNNHRVFLRTGEILIDSATAIKNNTQKTYDEARAVADKTQETIQNNMNNLMLNNGLDLKAVNDGSGNVNLFVVVKQS